MTERELKQKVARKLREIRGGLSQDAFADMCGLTQAQVSQYEAARSMPGLAILIQISKATGADLNEFVRLAGIETKEEGHE